MSEQKEIGKTICEYSKPNEKPPFHCRAVSKNVIDFGIDQAYVCEEHYIYFYRDVVPYLDD